MGWFLSILIQIIELLLYAVLFFGSIAAVSCVGFCLNRGFRPYSETHLRSP